MANAGVERERKFLILTNNPMYTPGDLAHRLQSNGLDVTPERIFTSAMATPGQAITRSSAAASEWQAKPKLGSSGRRPRARRASRMMELGRWAALPTLPITLQPKFFPANGELACWMILAAQQAGGQEPALRLTGAIGQAGWQQERHIPDPQTLAVVAGESGFDAPALLAAARDPAIAARRGRMTDEALAAGVFGAPSYVVAGEVFWGQDRLEFVERKLAS